MTARRIAEAIADLILDDGVGEPDVDGEIRLLRDFAATHTQVRQRLVERIRDLLEPEPELPDVPPAIGEAGLEYMILVDHGGRGGIFGRDERRLGQTTVEDVRAAATKLLVDQAEQVAVYERDVSEWRRLRTGRRVHSSSHNWRHDWAD